jgi:hypothetical protein
MVFAAAAAAAATAADLFQVDWGSLVPGRTAEQVRQAAAVVLLQQLQQGAVSSLLRLCLHRRVAIIQ